MLDRLMDDEDLVRKIIHEFLTELPRRIGLLEACLQSADTDGAKLQAHTIKGAAACMGGEILRSVAFEIEKAAQAGDLDAVKERMEALAAAFDCLRQKMEQAY